MELSIAVLAVPCFHWATFSSDSDSFSIGRQAIGVHLHKLGSSHGPRRTVPPLYAELLLT